MIQTQRTRQTGSRRGEAEIDLGDYENLFDLTSELFCLTDSQGDVKKINSAFAHVLERDPADDHPVQFESWIHPDDRAKTLQALSESVAQGTSVDVENRIQVPKGEVRWMLWNVTPLGKGDLYHWAARDVTERKAREEQREYSDRLLKHTVNSLPFLVAYLDLDFNYQFMNKAYERWLGELAFAAQRGDLELAVGQELAQSLRAHREEARRTGLPNRFEGSFRNVQGEKVYLEIQYHPHLNSKGEVEGLMALAYDVTKIKEANRSLLNSETRLQRLLNTGKIGFWETDLATGTTQMSDNIRDWLGLPEGSSYTNIQLRDTVHPEDRQKVVEAQKEVVTTQQPKELEFRTRKPDGTLNWVITTSYPTLDENGKVIGIMGTSVDVTERKQMEQILQMQQARMMTSSRLTAIGEMASGVAHEINNPLAIIFSNAEILKMNSLRGRLTPEMVERSAAKIETTVMRISKIIHSLRSLSRDSERDPFEPVAIRKIVEEALEICTQRFRSHQIQLKVEIPREDITLYARPTQISQVLLNLLNNAHDAVENLKERWVEVAIRDLGEQVEISVTDSGPGIPADLRGKIFDPFFTTKEPMKGTGLGLSVSKSIVSSHGGTLQINSQAPTTQFLVRLPKNGKPTTAT